MTSAGTVHSIVQIVGSFSGGNIHVKPPLPPVYRIASKGGFFGTSGQNVDERAKMVLLGDNFFDHFDRISPDGNGSTTGAVAAAAPPPEEEDVDVQKVLANW